MSLIKLPEGVSSHLAQALNKIQEQMVVLARNQKILLRAIHKEPKNPILKQKLTWVEEYIIEFNKEQKPILAQIRAEVKALKSKEAQPTHIKEESAPSVKIEAVDEPTVKKEADEPEAKPKADEDAKITPAAAVTVKKESTSSPEPESAAPSTPAAPEAAPPASAARSGVNGKVSMQDRMAAVRNAKKNSKRGGRKKKAATKDQRTPSPLQEGDDSSDWTKYTDPNDDLKEGQYKAHISEVEKFTADVMPYYEAAKAPVEFPIRKTNAVFPVDPNNCTKEMRLNYFRHLDLYTPVDIETILKVRRKDRKRKYDFRNMTLIPEFTEKKQRFNYNWLTSENGQVNSNFSPPHLRTRGGRPRNNPALSRLDQIDLTSRGSSKRRPVTSSSAPPSSTATAAPSRNTSRASTPDTVVLSREPSAISIESSTDMGLAAASIKSEKGVDANSSLKASIKSEENSESFKENETGSAAGESTKITKDGSGSLQSDMSTGSATAPALESKRSMVRDRQRAKLLKKKPDLELEFNLLSERVKELNVLIDGNGLTVATRKERSKKTLLIKERKETEEQLKKVTETLDKIKELE